MTAAVRTADVYHSERRATNQVGNPAVQADGEVGLKAKAHARHPGQPTFQLKVLGRLQMQRSKNDGRVSFADSKPVSPSHNPKSPKYSPSPAHRQSINIFTEELLDLSHTPPNRPFNPGGICRPSTYGSSSSHPSRRTPNNPKSNPNSNPNEPRRPSRYIFSSISHPPPPIIRSPPMDRPAPNQSPQINESPRISPRTLNQAGTHRPTISPSSHSPGKQVTHQSAPNPWQTHRKSSNPFATFPKTGTPNIPKVPGLTAPPPPPPAGPPPKSQPTPPPLSKNPMPSPAPQTNYTDSKRKPPTKRTSIKKIRGSEAPRKNEKIKPPKLTSKSSTKTQSTVRIRSDRIPPPRGGPSRNTRAMAMERRRRGQRSLVKGTRFGYEELERVEAEARGWIE